MKKALRGRARRVWRRFPPPAAPAPPPRQQAHAREGEGGEDEAGRPDEKGGVGSS